jgi:hypothetical protein
MIFNGTGAACLITYSCWRFWNLLNREKNNTLFDKLFLVEASYAVLMTYLLATGSFLFIFLSFMAFSTFLVKGMYISNLAQPPPAQEKVSSFWKFLFADAVISASTYILFVTGGII